MAVGSQVATNALNGKPLGDGVLMAGAIGLASSVGMGAAAKVGGKVLGKVLGRAAEAAESEVAGAAEEAESSVASSVEEGASCALSFAPDTQVATPTGEQAIGTLQVGDHVTAYDPATGKTSTQTVQHVWINHDTDLIDVTLRVADQQGTAANDAKARHAAVVAHGLRAPPVDAAADAAEVTAPATHDELIHTTAKHPWLTTDRGFVLAGMLHAGERVVREDGTPATVVAVVVRPGAAAYYNLTVSVLHTYAVGVGRYVVHNCTPEGRVANARARKLDRLLQRATGMADDAYKGKVTVAVGVLKNGKWIAALNEGAGDLAETFAPIVKRFGGEYVGPTAFVGGGKHAEAFILEQAGEDGGDLLGIGASNYLCEDCTPLFDDAIRGTPGRNPNGSIRPVG